MTFIEMLMTFFSLFIWANIYPAMVSGIDGIEDWTTRLFTIFGNIMWLAVFAGLIVLIIYGFNNPIIK